MTPNGAGSVLATWRTTREKTGEFRSVSNQGLVKMRELDPGACAFSVDSVDWSTPVADMPSIYRTCRLLTCIHLLNSPGNPNFEITRVVRDGDPRKWVIASFESVAFQVYWTWSLCIALFVMMPSVRPTVSISTFESRGSIEGKTIFMFACVCL